MTETTASTGPGASPPPAAEGLVLWGAPASGKTGLLGAL